MCKDKLKELLSLEEDKLVRASSYTAKFECINNIIQLKLKINDNSYLKSIYIDLKHLIDFNIESVNERSYSYDNIKFETIEKYLDCCNIEEQFSIGKYFERKLKNSNFENESIIATDIRKKYEIYFLLSKIKMDKCLLFNFLRLVLCATSFNLITIIATIIFVILIKFTTFLPAPFDWMGIFTITYDNYTDNTHFNMVLNAIASLVGISENFSMTPLTPLALLLLVIEKISIFILFINFIFKEIERRVFR